MILTLDEISKAKTSASIDGVAAGTCAGFLGGFLTTRVFKQSKNIGFLSGFMTGIVAGYLFTQASLGSHLAAANLNKLNLKKSLNPDLLNEFVSPDLIAIDEPNLSKDRGSNIDFEGGSNGLENFKDKYNSTSGNN